MTSDAKTESRAFVVLPPDSPDLVVMAVIAVPFGIKGWVKLQTFTEDENTLADYEMWWVEQINPKAGWRLCKREAFEVKPNGVLAKFESCNDRTMSEAYRGRRIALLRSELPPLEDNEAYQVDLIGYAVLNLQGHEFGRIVEFLETGANDIMVCRAQEREFLIPVIDSVIHAIQHDERRVLIDWQLDYL
jgi:16S rRNA processing protein RimM